MYSFGSSTSYNACNLCNYFRTIGSSVSRWCSNGCSTCEDHAHGCCIMPFYAYLTQTAAVNIAAETPIPFTGVNLISDGFELENGLLMLPCPGVYMVNYRVRIPLSSTVNTSFVVRVDGVDIAGTQQSVVHNPGFPPATLSAQAIFEISEGAAVGLYTTAALDLPVSTGGDPVATMTIVAL